MKFTYLNPGFRQINFQGHFLSHEDIRIPRFTEQRFQDVQLGPCERRAFPSLFPWISC